MNQRGRLSLALVASLLTGLLLGFWYGRASPGEERRRTSSSARPGATGTVDGGADQAADCASLKSESCATILLEHIPVLPRARAMMLHGDGQVTLLYSTRRGGRVVEHTYEGLWASGSAPTHVRLCLQDCTLVDSARPGRARTPTGQQEEAHTLPWHIELRFRSEVELEWVSADEGFRGSRWRFRRFGRPIR